MFERRKFKSLFKNKCGDECYGCSVYSQSVSRANHALMHTHWVYDILTTGYSDFARSIKKASDGRNTKRADEDTPLFVCWAGRKNKSAGNWASARINLVLAEKYE